MNGDTDTVNPKQRSHMDNNNRKFEIEMVIEFEKTQVTHLSSIDS